MDISVAARLLYKKLPVINVNLKQFSTNKNEK